MLMPVLRRRSLPDKRPVRITTSCTPPLSKRQSTLVLAVIITEPGGKGGNGGGGGGDGGDGGDGLATHCIQYTRKSNRDHFNDAMSQTAQLTQLQCIPGQSSRGSSPRMIHTCVHPHTNTLALLSLSVSNRNIKERKSLLSLSLTGRHSSIQLVTALRRPIHT